MTLKATMWTLNDRNNMKCVLILQDWYNFKMMEIIKSEKHQNVVKSRWDEVGRIPTNLKMMKKNPNGFMRKGWLILELQIIVSTLLEL